MIKITRLDDPIQELMLNGSLHTDHRVVHVILSIKDTDVRIAFAERMAKPGIKIKSIIKAGRALNYRIENPDREDRNPATHQAQHNNGSHEPIYGELAKRDKLPHWDLVKHAADKACGKCSYSDHPVPMVCNDCPAVLLISELLIISFKQKEKNDKIEQLKHNRIGSS